MDSRPLLLLYLIILQIPAQLAYTKEKIEPSAFSSGATVDALIHDMEALFAARFGSYPS